MKKRTFLIPLFAVFALAGCATTTAGFPDECTLCQPIVDGNTAEVKRLLNAGANPNQTTNSFGANVFDLAVWNAQTESIKILLAAGANVNAANDTGWTALHITAHKGRTEIAKILMSAGANPRSTGSLTLSPLALAEENRRDETAKVLRNFTPSVSPEEYIAGLRAEYFLERRTQ